MWDQIGIKSMTTRQTPDQSHDLRYVKSFLNWARLAFARQCVCAALRYTLRFVGEALIRFKFDVESHVNVDPTPRSRSSISFVVVSHHVV
jgi:hypothetical protein